MNAVRKLVFPDSLGTGHCSNTTHVCKVSLAYGFQIVQFIRWPVTIKPHCKNVRRYKDLKKHIDNEEDDVIRLDSGR